MNSHNLHKTRKNFLYHTKSVPEDLPELTSNKPCFNVGLLIYK